MTSATKSEWLIPTGLRALSTVALLAGALRLVQLGGWAHATAKVPGWLLAAPLPRGAAHHRPHHLLRPWRVAVRPRLSPPQSRLASCCRSGSGPLRACRSTLCLVDDPVQPVHRLRRHGSLSHPAPGGLGNGLVPMAWPGCSTEARHSEPPRLDDAGLRARPRCGHAGSDSPALVPDPRHTKRTEAHAVHGGGLGHQPCRGRADRAARAPRQGSVNIVQDWARVQARRDQMRLNRVKRFTDQRILVGAYHADGIDVEQGSSPRPLPGSR